MPPPGGGRAAQREDGALSAAGAPAVAVGGWRMRLAAAWDGDVAWSFRHSPVALASALVLAACLAGSALAQDAAPAPQPRSFNLAPNLLLGRQGDAIRPGFRRQSHDALQRGVSTMPLVARQIRRVVGLADML